MFYGGVLDWVVPEGRGKALMCVMIGVKILTIMYRVCRSGEGCVCVSCLKGRPVHDAPLSIQRERGGTDGRKGARIYIIN